MFKLREGCDPTEIVALTVGPEQKEGSSETGREVGSASFGTATPLRCYLFFFFLFYFTFRLYNSVLM